MRGFVKRGSDIFKKVNGFEEERETRAAEQEQEEGYHNKSGLFKKFVVIWIENFSRTNVRLCSATQHDICQNTG